MGNAIISLFLVHLAGYSLDARLIIQTSSISRYERKKFL